MTISLKVSRYLVIVANDDANLFCRSDCLQYKKYEHGISTGIVTNLKEYSEQFKDMVTFYLGCSFTFEKALQKAGIPVRNVEQKCNVSMYKVRTEERNSKRNLKKVQFPFGKRTFGTVSPGDLPSKYLSGSNLHYL